MSDTLHLHKTHLLLILIAIISVGSLYSDNILYVKVIEDAKDLENLNKEIVDLRASIRYIHKDATKADAVLETHIDMSRELFLKLFDEKRDRR